jgi:nicotinate-nucleotide adenylyltransferase
LKRIGLYGGSFDPVHLGHLALARMAVEHLSLDELRVLPAGDAWQKQRELAPAEHRAAMLALAIQGEPHLVLDRCELDRNGPSYMIDTVRHLKATRGPGVWFLVIGQDQYGQLHTWHQWRELAREVTFAVAEREGVAPTPSEELQLHGHRVVPLPLPRIDISSSEIRRRIALGEEIASMVPAAVGSYIDQHRLYRGHTGN